MGAESRVAQIRTVKSPLRLKSRRNSKTGESRPGDLIRQVLSGLANLAINSDLSMGELGEMAKDAYVTAAARRARRPSGTLNRSRIAAITGLTRAEVADLLRSPTTRTSRDTRSRARRVVDGWRKDRRFSARSAVPRPLPLHGKAGSFEHLVRLYAGDVPPRAMLDRLVGLSLVAVAHSRRSHREVVQLRDTNYPPPLEREQIEILQAFSGALDESRSPWVAKISVPVSDPIQLAILRKTIAEKGQVLLSGITAANPRQRSLERSLTVFVGMSDVLDAGSVRAQSTAEPRKRRKN